MTIKVLNVAALCCILLAGGFARAQTFPSINTAGTTKNQTPITSFQAPSDVPAGEMPTPQGPAVGIESAIQSYSVSQNNPTTAQPSCPEPPAAASYSINDYYWPTVVQSIEWWESQPGVPAIGTFAYQVGVSYSHQDQEGWAGGCTPDPQPSCPTGPGYSGFTFGGQYVGWTGSCTYTAPPACSGTGDVGNYSWNGTEWVGTCSYVSPPYCPVGYNDTYAWEAASSSYTGSCTQPAEPSCPAGYNGSYEWDETTGAWVDDCSIPAPPVCPSGDTGSYVWTGSSYADECVAPTSAAPSVAPIQTVFNIEPANYALGQVQANEGTPLEIFQVTIATPNNTCTVGATYQATSVTINGLTSSQWAANGIAEGWQALAPDLIGQTFTCQSFSLALQSDPGTDQTVDAIAYEYRTESADNPAFPIPTSSGTYTPNGDLIGSVSAWTFTAGEDNVPGNDGG